MPKSRLRGEGGGQEGRLRRWGVGERFQRVRAPEEPLRTKEETKMDA